MLSSQYSRRWDLRLTGRVSFFSGLVCKKPDIKCSSNSSPNEKPLTPTCPTFICFVLKRRRNINWSQPDLSCCWSTWTRSYRPYSIIDSILAQTSYNGSVWETFANLSTETSLDYDFENVIITKIFFKTTNENGAPIIGSGIVIIPAIETPLGLISFQHSTINLNSEALSNSALGRNELTVASVTASTGCITMLSDYIGYEINFFQRHPYEHIAILANNTYAMSLAVESFLLLPKLLQVQELVTKLSFN